MAIEAVRAQLKNWGRDGDILEFDASSATVDLAAQALHCEGARIAKSLSFRTPDGIILVVAAGDTRMDNKKYRNEFGTKAKMLPREEVLERIGHDVGGVCPFGIKEGVRVYLDRSLRRFTTVYPACGSSNSAIELSCDELAEYSDAEGWVDVCRIPESAQD